MQLTLNDIIENARPHAHIENGKHTLITTDKFVFSIVGGGQGLYGDFVNDFELAILKKSDREFCTKFLVEYATDDVLPYTPGEELLKIISPHLKNGFQVG